MNASGKDLVLKALKHDSVGRAPWIPFAGVHAGKLKNYTATEILTDGNKLLECLLEVNRLYRPDGQPVVFDLQIEAEILGCQLKWADKSPPSVVSHPFSTSKTIPDKIPGPSEGRLPVVLEAMRKMKSAVGGMTALFGLVTGPLTLALHLRGTQLFLDTVMNKPHAQAMMQYTSKVAKAVADYYIDAGMDVVAIVDPVVSQISPAAFSGLLLEPCKDIFSHIKSRGALSSFFVCGDATKNLDPMCRTAPDSIFVDENIDMAAAKAVTDKYNITLGGNVPLTRTMLHGTQADNMKFVVDLIDKLGKMNFIVAPGCDMPYDTPIDNVVGAAQAAHETDAVRKALKNYQATEINIDVALPDYERLEKPLIEVFTIDSDVCAACGYMMGMAKLAVEKYGDRVRLVEYKWTELENIARAKKMGVQHLPCIYINGKLKYSSIIPSQGEYLAEVGKLIR